MVATQADNLIRLRCHKFEPNRLVGVVVKHIGAGGLGFDFLGRYRPLAQLLSVQAMVAEGLGFDSWDGQIGSPPLRRFCVTQALRDGPQ